MSSYSYWAGLGWPANRYYQSPGSEAAANGAKLWAKAHGGFWGPWLPGQRVPEFGNPCPDDTKLVWELCGILFLFVIHMI